MDLRSLGRFVVAVDAVKFLARRAVLGVEAFDLAAFTFLQWRVDKYFDELADSNKPRASSRSAQKAK